MKKSGTKKLPKLNAYGKAGLAETLKMMELEPEAGKQALVILDGSDLQVHKDVAKHVRAHQAKQAAKVRS